MNILFLRSILDTYGASKMMFQLADGLIDKGYKIVFGSDNQDNFKAYLNTRGIRHYAIPLNPNKKNVITFLVSLIKIAFIVKKEKINLIHSHHRWSSFISFFVSKVFRIPLITTYHGISQNNRRLTLWGDRVISVSEDAKSHLIGYFKVNPGNIVVIHNGVKISDDFDNAEDTSNHFSETKIAYIARLSPEKDHKTLFQALKRVLKDFPSLRVLLVGTGPLENELRDLAFNIGISNNIDFIGEVDDINSILKRVDFIVLSSFTEGMPISILEALAAGKPVVATDVGDVGALVINNKTGYLVPPKNPKKLADAIYLMLSNKEKAKEMGKNGRMLIKENFGIDKMVEQTENLYLELLNHKFAR